MPPKVSDPYPKILAGIGGGAKWYLLRMIISRIEIQYGKNC